KIQKSNTYHTAVAGKCVYCSARLIPNFALHPKALKKTYFISDIHLGFPNEEESRQREKLLLQWFDMAAKDAECIYIVGDLFDFWFEYKRSVPKGFTRILGKLAELTDAGLPIVFFTGNHDLWMSGYFEKELHIPVLREPISKEIQ